MWGMNCKCNPLYLRLTTWALTHILHLPFLVSSLWILSCWILRPNSFVCLPTLPSILGHWFIVNCTAAIPKARGLSGTHSTSFSCSTNYQQPRTVLARSNPGPAKQYQSWTQPRIKTASKEEMAWSHFCLGSSCTCSSSADFWSWLGG